MCTAQISMSGNIVCTPELVCCFDSTFPFCGVISIYIAEMHKISLNLTVNNHNVVDNFTFAVMHLHSNKSSSGVQAVATKIINSLSL